MLEKEKYKYNTIILIEIETQSWCKLFCSQKNIFYSRETPIEAQLLLYNVQSNLKNVASDEWHGNYASGC